MPEMIYGTDIKIVDGELQINTEDFDLVSGVETGVQDVIQRLSTPKGSLFYAKEYGSRLHEFIQASKDNFTIKEFVVEIKTVLKEDPRVDNESITVTIGDATDGFYASVTFRFLDDDNSHNLVVSADKDLNIWESE